MDIDSLVSGKPKGKTKGRGKSSSSAEPKSEGYCKRCGKYGHMGKDCWTDLEKLQAVQTSQQQSLAKGKIGSGKGLRASLPLQSGKGKGKGKAKGKSEGKEGKAYMS